MEDDAQLIARSRHQPALFGALVDRHLPALHRYAAHRLGADHADDVAAETFARAFAARHRYKSHTADARAWLFAIATNLIRDELRRRARGDGLLERLRGQRTPDVAMEPLTSADPALAAAVAGLREPEREVLLLFAWAELSYEEIAAVTGTAVGTVRSRLSRAREHVRAALVDDLEITR
jgi:RNA polymerase sigma factor (sigma-70 family)